MTTCFHCGTPIAADMQVPPLAVDGADRPFCSSGCREVAAAIVDDGLAGFYRFRTAPGVTPDARSLTPDRWAAYDRPGIQREFVRVASDGTPHAQLLLPGVRCAACVWLIERAMPALPGVVSVSVEPLTGRAEVAWDPARIPLSDILRRLAALGYAPSPYAGDAADEAATTERRQALKRLIVAGLGMMQVGSFALALYLGAFQSMDAEIEFFLRMISLVVATPVVFYAGSPFFVGGWRNLRQRTLGMDVPVALAIGAAWAASVWNTFTGGGEVYFDSATMFVFLLGVARYLEMAGRHRALSLTGALARHLPRVAMRVRADGRAEEVGVMELEAGDLVLVAPGTAIPADGTISDGEMRVDESLLTGESTPVLRRAGDAVYAGSMNLLQAARVQVRHVGADTALANISQLVTAAGDDKPRLVRLADRIAVGFVGRLLVVTAGVAAWWLYAAPDRAFEIVLSVLVVTCPCALAIATPAVYTVAMSTLARHGFLVRRPGALEGLARTTHVVFDKTGTLTETGVALESVVALGRLDAGAATELAAQLEARSEHPLARAFPAPADLGECVEVTAVPGQGLTGQVDGRAVRIGRLDFVQVLAGPVDGQVTAAPTSGTPDEAADDPASAGSTRAVWLGDEDGLLARFKIAERLRPGAVTAIARLAALGIEPSIASGDHRGAVRAMARRLGIESWHADLRPADKLTLLRTLQQRDAVITMVGDGINDSPVLAGADVSIAMGSGASLAQYAADCILINPSLETIGFAVQTARRAMRAVRQNFAWAIAYNVSAIPLAAAGFVEPWMAAIGMSASSLLVTLNALRLGRCVDTEAGPAVSRTVPPAAMAPAPIP